MTEPLTQIETEAIRTLALMAAFADGGKSDVERVELKRIGKAHGCELDRGHIKELLGVAGVGLTSQVVEGYARKLLGGLLGKVGGYRTQFQART